ncbi:Cyclopropane-fatty-acyl-phospholipid synthase [Rhodococcus sp. WAY2]|nr:Cyclopropane-fatty-acyl-phospholipid synthase [Rhodococcus sp. WAY2]
MTVRTTAPTAATRLLDAFEGVIGIPLPVRVRCWDGSEAASPASVCRNTRARRPQVLAVRPSDDGSSGLPRTRSLWLG